MYQPIVSEMSTPLEIAHMLMQTIPGTYIAPAVSDMERTLAYISDNICRMQVKEGVFAPRVIRELVFTLFKRGPLKTAENFHPHFVDINRMRGVALASIIPGINAMEDPEKARADWFRLCSLISKQGCPYFIQKKKPNLVRLVKLGSPSVLEFSDMDLWNMPIAKMNDLFKTTWDAAPIKTVRLNALDYIISSLPSDYVVSGTMVISPC